MCAARVMCAKLKQLYAPGRAVSVPELLSRRVHRSFFATTTACRHSRPAPPRRRPFAVSECVSSGTRGAASSDAGVRSAAEAAGTANEPQSVPGDEVGDRPHRRHMEARRQRKQAGKWVNRLARAPRGRKDLGFEYDNLVIRTQYQVATATNLHKMLDCVETSEDLDMAMDALLVMFTSHARLDANGGTTSAKLVNACLRSHQPWRAIQLLEKPNTYGLKPTRKAFVRIASYGGKFRDPAVVHDALRLFRDYECEFNNKVAHTFIKAFCDAGHVLEALQLALSLLYVCRGCLNVADRNRREQDSKLLSRGSANKLLGALSTTGGGASKELIETATQFLTHMVRLYSADSRDEAVLAVIHRVERTIIAVAKARYR